MTDHEILLLAIGFTLGMYAMLAVHIAFGIRDDRRDRKAARAAMAQLEAARAVADLRESKSTESGTSATSGETTVADLPPQSARKAAATQSSATPADLRESTAAVPKRTAA